MKTGHTTLIASIAFAGLMSGCAATAPELLVKAREAYAASSAGLSAKLTPTDLYEARKVLDQANSEFEENGDTPICRDYAYMATRKIQLADTKARTEDDRQKIAETVKAVVAVRAEQTKETQAALDSTRTQLETERRDNDEQSRVLDNTTAQLEVEKEARSSAEAKLAGAMKDLSSIAAVREDDRGVVITLSGSVIFASGKSELLSTARTKLDQVAEALKAQPADKRIIVEGHTDSQGPDRVNQPLSLARANVVREHLISRGVSSEKISAVGMGSTKPITDNKTAENRANNRRVEIIIGAGVGAGAISSR